MHLSDLPTPSLLLDRRVLARNLNRMVEQARRLGVRLRPHLKTAKSLAVARLALGQDGDGLTVSTLAEARYFLDGGFRDITYAVGITPGKLDEALAMAGRGAALTLLTDDMDAARAVAARAEAAGACLPVLIEIDSGQGRAGLLPGDAAVAAIGRLLHDSPGTALAGVLTHAGHSYNATSPAALRAVAEAERAAVTQAAERLRAAGLPCPNVSVGSTPTALSAERLDGVTEIRPGVYMFMDLFQAGLGLCTESDVAVSVLTSVIGRYPARGQALIDAGALALSQDQSQRGYGRIAGRPIRVAAVNQEHGFLEAAGGGALPPLPVGERLRVLPNHACMTAAMYDRYHVVEDDLVTEVWDRCRGW